MRRPFTDQLSRTIIVNHPPQRIISLVPSQTELLFDLGFAARIVGITKFCVHPAAHVKNVAKVGGTKQLNFDAIRSLQPDLIIGNKEENEQQQIESLMEEFPVWMSDIDDLSSSLAMIHGIGQLTGRYEQAAAVVTNIQNEFSKLSPLTMPLKALYLIWQNPFMAAGTGTFINDMLKRCGFVNVVQQARYPELTATGIQNLQPDVVLLSSEPYPFKQKHIQQFNRLLPSVKVLLVDGEVFSWYGSRMQLAPAYFEQLIAKLAL